MTKSEIKSLLIELKSGIADDYRFDYDSSDDDQTPSMCVTVATTDGGSWSYQTGDNSYSGGCYSFQHWHVLCLTRRSNSAELASEAFEELMGMIEEAKECEAWQRGQRENARLAVYNRDEPELIEA